MAFTVSFADHPAAVLERAGRLLETQPVVNNLVATLLATRRAEREPGRYWTVASDGDPVGIVFQSPLHFRATLTAMPPEAVDEVVAAIASAGVHLPGVHGEAATAARFAGAWAEQHRSAAAPVEGQRIYELRDLQPPAGVPGRPRRATPADRELVLEAMRAFEGEVREGVVDGRIRAGQFWVWEDGVPVSVAAHTDPVAGVCRIQAVYTPPDRRRRGYAGACVSAVSTDRRARGLGCMLYADLANPVSNSVYRRIGYRAVAECLVYRFT